MTKVFRETITKHVTKHNMTLEYMINFNTGQINSGTVGYPRPQFSSCSTSKESKSINYSDSQKSASNFKSASLHINNISAQKKNTDTREETATTSFSTAEVASAAAASKSHLRRLAAGRTVAATHALGNSSNKRVMIQGTIVRPSTQLVGQKARPPPPPPQTPPPLKPSILQIKPGPTPPSLPPQRRATRGIAVNTPGIHEGNKRGRNKHDLQLQGQNSKQLQIEHSLMPHRNANANACNDNQNIEGSKELTIKNHEIIVLQRTYKKRNAIRWQQATPPSAPQRLPPQPESAGTKYRHEQDEDESSKYNRQQKPRARACLTTSTPWTGLIQPRQSPMPPQISAITQVNQQETHQGDHKHEAPIVLARALQGTNAKIAQKRGNIRQKEGKKKNIAGHTKSDS